jgi:hypothetical protein
MGKANAQPEHYEAAGVNRIRLQIEQLEGHGEKNEK